MTFSKQSDNLDRFAKTAMLYDFYGTLLTKKQGEIIELYFMDDLSLSEIGEELGITRQAAGILINRTEKILESYENMLGLVEKHIAAKGKTDLIISALKEIRETAYMESAIAERLNEIINLIGEL